MNILDILKILALLATAATGALSFFKPAAIYGFIGLTAQGARGISEVRAIFGGLFIALGAVPLILGMMPAMVQMVGYVYLGIAVARAISIVFDKSYAQSNLLSLVIEIVLGAILVF